MVRLLGSWLFFPFGVRSQAAIQCLFFFVLFFFTFACLAGVPAGGGAPPSPDPPPPGGAAADSGAAAPLPGRPGEEALPQHEASRPRHPGEAA